MSNTQCHAETTTRKISTISTQPQARKALNPPLVIADKDKSRDEDSAVLFSKGFLLLKDLL